MMGAGIQGIGRRFFCNALIGGAVLAASLPMPDATAQQYPDRPIRIIVPFAPGGSSDVLTRLVAQEMAGTLGQPVVIENRTGAGGNIGVEAAAKSAPDGYTFLSGSNSITIADLLFGKLGYDPTKDLVPVFLLGRSPMLVTVNPSNPSKSIAALVAAAKEKPGELSYASAGYGSMNHLATEMFKLQAGIDLTHVPYRGAPLAAVDVISGRVPILFDYMLTGLANVRDGKLRALAVTGEQRSPALPDVPTMKEAGFPDFNASLWFAFFAPAGTPKDAIDKVARAAIEALKKPEVKKRINDLGVEVVAEGADELKARLSADRERWQSVIQKSSIAKN